MISAEYDLRSSKKINKLIRRSRIRYPEAVIEERKNLIITGLTGAGKTYMACALGMAAIHQFMNVYLSLIHI